VVEVNIENLGPRGFRVHEPPSIMLPECLTACTFHSLRAIVDAFRCSGVLRAPVAPPLPCVSMPLHSTQHHCF
jgi:hypothetical protein